MAKIEVLTMRDLRSAIRNQPSVEHAYDWLPIHMPGAVQSYGVLLVVDPQTRRVQFVSDNAIDILSIESSFILDKSYLQLTDNEKERSLLKERITPETILFPNPVRLTIKGKLFDAVFHVQGRLHIIEIEAAIIDDASYDSMAMQATAELFDPNSLDDLYKRAVAVVRTVTGFDRVMLYRFDARYNGQVIAEAGRADIGSFLGLFFPSSDIGARSRELYLQNFTRYIPDINGKTHGLTGVFPGGGHAHAAHPVDMSHANLRAVAPCHITYLQNIGVAASMSFSINVDGRLWGLFACHHHTPRRVTYEQRVVCEQSAMMFIYRLAVMSSSASRLAQRQIGVERLGRTVTVGYALRQRLLSMAADHHGVEEDIAHTMLLRAVEAVQLECGLLSPAENTDYSRTNQVTEVQQLLLDVVEADSAAIIDRGRVCRIGDAPPEMSIYAIASLFGRELPDLRTGDLHVYATDSLASVVAAAIDIKDRAAGILATALSLETPSFLIWFRREQIVHATWAGNPASDEISEGRDGPNPRISFEAWKQDIRNLSRPWMLEDVEAAYQLSAVLREVQADRQQVVHSHDNTPARTVAQLSWPEPSVPGAVGYVDEPAAPLSVQRKIIRIGQR